MVWIEFPGLCSDQSLRLEHGLFSPNSLEVWIIRNDALQVKSLAWQDALLVRWWNLEICWQLKIKWGGRSTLC